MTAVMDLVDADERLTDQEREAIETYEEAVGVLESCLAGAEFLADRTEAETTDGDGLTAEQTREMDRAHILASFEWLSEWYELLDSLHSALRNNGEGAPFTEAGSEHLRSRCVAFFHTLNLVRREACRYAFGTAGPRPAMDSGYLTFGDIPGIELDGRIAAESL